MIHLEQLFVHRILYVNLSMLASYRQVVFVIDQHLQVRLVEYDYLLYVNFQLFSCKTVIYRSTLSCFALKIFEQMIPRQKQNNDTIFKFRQFSFWVFFFNTKIQSMRDRLQDVQGMITIDYLKILLLQRIFRVSHFFA